MINVCFLKETRQSKNDYGYLTKLVETELANLGIEYDSQVYHTYRLLNTFYKNSTFYPTTGTLMVQVFGETKVVKGDWVYMVKVIKEGLDEPARAI